MFNVFKILRSDLSEDSLEGLTLNAQRGAILRNRIKRNNRTEPPLNNPQPGQTMEDDDDIEL